jgi:hypothetical protein
LGAKKEKVRSNDMQTDCILINWEEALSKANAGTLLDDVLEAGSNEPWLYRPSCKEWPSDSTLQYLAVAKFIKVSASALSSTSQTALAESVAKFIAEVPDADDLPGALGDEGCIAMISPTNAAKMSKAMASIDREELKRCFEKHPNTAWADILQSFDEDVWQYLDQWRRMLDLAAARGMGLHAFMG